MSAHITNPFYVSANRNTPVAEPKKNNIRTYALLPQAPVTGSPVPHLTSLYHFSRAGEYGSRKYPGNCGGNLIRDLLLYFQPKDVFDPMTGSGTCKDVCKELGIDCRSEDIRYGFDAADPANFRNLPEASKYGFVWAHPPYWRQKLYTNDARDLSQTPTLEAFLERYAAFIRNCASVLAEGGKLVILMGDYSELGQGFVNLTYHTKQLAFAAGLKQHCTDIILFGHGFSSSKKVYRSSFIPRLHDVCMVFEKA